MPIPATLNRLGPARINYGRLRGPFPISHIPGGGAAAVAAIADWPGNELSGTVWEELIDDKDGTVTSATVKGHNGIFGDGFAWGFDGVNDRVRADGVAAAFNALGSEFTILGWIKSTDASPSSDENGFFFRSANGENIIELFNDTTDGEIHALFKTANTTQTELSVSGQGLGWVPFAVVMSQVNNVMKLRINGVNSSIDTSFLDFDADVDEFYFGSDNSSKWWLGSLAHFEIWPLLTDAQIDAIHDRTSGYTKTFFTMDARQPADPLTLHHLTNKGATRTTSPFASGGAYLNQPNHNENLNLFVDSHVDLHPQAGKTLYFGAWVRFDDDGNNNTIVLMGAANGVESRNYLLNRRAATDLVRIQVANGANNENPTDIAASSGVDVFVAFYINYDTKTVGLSVNGSAYNTKLLTQSPNQVTDGVFALGRLTPNVGFLLNGTLGPVVLINQPKANADPLPGIYNSGTPLTTLALIEAEIDTPANLKLCNLWPVTNAI